mgnify:CR=1 FL=1
MISQLDQVQICNMICNSNIDQQNKRIRLFSRIPIEDKLGVLEKQRPKFYKLNEEYKEFDIEKSVLSYCALILAIEELDKNLDEVNKKVIKFENKIRVTTQKEKLLSYWSVVVELKKKKNYSYRKIAEYLATYFKFHIGYTTIYETWKELEEKENNDAQ